MAIELVTKYLPYVDELFTTESKKSLLTNNDFDWTGAHTVKTYKIGTTTMTDYDRAGTGSGAAGSRYGTIGNLSASTQPHVITKDRSFTFVIDKLDSDETGKALEAASALARQLREVVVPEVDAYVYGKMCAGAGTKPAALTLTADNIIILSAKSEDADKILGLNVGADDYVTKPFSPLELVARVKSQLRRYTQLGGTAQNENDKIYSVGGLRINDDLKEVTVDGELVRLTPIEYNILLLLMKNQGRVFSINQIYEMIWNEEAIGADNTVAVHIRHIREKIEINPKEPRYLKVVWGVGYKIEKVQ